MVSMLFFAPKACSRRCNHLRQDTKHERRVDPDPTARQCDQGEEVLSISGTIAHNPADKARGLVHIQEESDPALHVVRAVSPGTHA